MLKAQLRKIKNLEARINPNHEWVLHNREKLMTQIGHSSKQTVSEFQVAPKVGHSINTWTKIFVPQSLVHSIKPFASVVVALVLTSAGWIASAYAEPGDVLWNAKNAFNSVVENSRLILASEQEQTSLHLNFASKQAHVLKQVVETDKLEGEEKAKLVDKTVENLQKKLDSAQESIKTLLPSEAAGLVKEVSLSTQDISHTLQETVKNATDNGISEKIEKTVVETTKQSLEMVGDTVQKKAEANLEFSPEEKEIVKDHINQAVDSMVAEVIKTQSKLGQSGATTTLVIVPTSTLSIGNISTSTVIVSTTTTIDEQKKVVDSLKETNLLEAINTTKVLADQVTTMIEKATVQTNTFNATNATTSSTGAVASPTKTPVSITPTSSITTSSTR